MIKTLVFILLLMLLFGCRTEGNVKSFEKCKFSEKNIPSLFFYIDSLFVEQKRCTYKIKSNFFDEKFFTGKLTVIGNDIYVKFSNKLNKYELLFSFESKFGENNEISILHRNWKEGKGTEFIETKNRVIIENIYNLQEEQVAILRFPKIVSDFTDIEILDAIIFFSNKKGFIGSYYLNPEYPKDIIKKEGDILENCVDYSDYTFSVIQ